MGFCLKAYSPRALGMEGVFQIAHNFLFTGPSEGLMKAFP